MAGLVGMVKTGKWDKVGFILNAPSFDKRIKRNAIIAHHRVALDYRKDVRADIRGKKYAPNKAMTIAIKGSSTPLVDNADMINAITYKIDGDEKVEIGIKRSATSGDGKKLFNVAEILHGGATVRVTDRMRNFFKAMWAQGQSGWFPLLPTTVAIRIPARPFFRVPFEQNQDKYLNHYEEAVRATMQGK